MCDCGDKQIKPLPIEIQPLCSRDLSIPSHGIYGNHQWTYDFPNGYGASVVIGPYSYGGPEGLYELAVLKRTGSRPHDTKLCYDTPLTDDVIGWLTVADVAAKLLEVAAL